MSLTYGFNDAVDVFKKMIRDAQFLESEVTKDHFWNFVMTANSLIDWIEQGTYSSALKDEARNVIWKKGPVQACRDICNASKHRTITLYTPKTASALSEQGFGAGRFGYGPFGVGEEEIQIEYNGNTYDALDFMYSVTDIWGKFFKKHGLISTAEGDED